VIDGYKIKDGKVIVVNYDEYGDVDSEEREYQDNIEELLIAENVEEHLNKLKLEADKEIKDNEYKIERNNIAIGNDWFIIFISNFFGLTLCLAIPWIPLIISFIGTMLLVVPKIISKKKENKKIEKEILGNKLTLEGICEQVKKNQKDLRRLRNDNRCECENVRNGYKQFDLVELDDINKYLDLWYFVGYNEEDMNCAQNNQYLEEYLEDKNFRLEERKTMKRILNRNKRR